jgi:hypothetical protein
MAFIVFSGKDLQPASLYCHILHSNGTPERPPKTPRNISEKHSQLENLLRSGARLPMRRSEPFAPSRREARGVEKRDS